MTKWILTMIALFFLGLAAFSVLQNRALRFASLINGRNRLKVSYEGFVRLGHITNYPLSGYQVSLATNTVTINGQPYQLFARVEDGWGYGGGSLAMTTNQIFIWLDPIYPPKIITNGFRPSLFSKCY